MGYFKLATRQSRRFKLLFFFVIVLLAVTTFSFLRCLSLSRIDVGSGPLIPRSRDPYASESESIYSENNLESIYVLSLPHRNDRRARMEFLRTYLGLNWTYVEATSAEEEVVGRIMANVRRLREEAMRGRVDLQIVKENTTEREKPVKLPFEWPTSKSQSHSEIKTQILSSLATFDIYSSNPASAISDREEFSQFLVNSNETSSLELVCATRDFSLARYSPTLPYQKFLTPARVACWYSHLMVLRRIVERNNAYYELSPGRNMSNEHISIIFEDDIDVEKDIRQRLARIWHVLPGDWDIVFLGHCWSNESFYPAISLSESSSSPLPSSSLLFDLDPRPLSPLPSQNTLHPSYSPRCTHAYALSPSGATKLLEHLEYPPFAYSRAIDQAYAWLVMSGRVRAYSVVGSLVVQLRSGRGGDIWIPARAREGSTRGSRKSVQSVCLIGCGGWTFLYDTASDIPKNAFIPSPYVKEAAVSAKHIILNIEKHTYQKAVRESYIGGSNAVKKLDLFLWPLQFLHKGHSYVSYSDSILDVH
ncbi:hypothetical protein BT96DRAFT_976330 [Gymnopus androsaceus JB14]|uniref:Glycosyl transferase family 25 domain-containing protein n=1 Tax=Gymnopus androsaceus JB14 TaxID=1447944 RepID=A0A6A4HNP2_9AGAR|nr:hypothetical protein BT96DRAFT_976330 [Gymnopus androsaceus JB14]